MSHSSAKRPGVSLDRVRLIWKLITQLYARQMKITVKLLTKLAGFPSRSSTHAALKYLQQLGYIERGPARAHGAWHVVIRYAEREGFK